MYTEGAEGDRGTQRKAQSDVPTASTAALLGLGGLMAVDSSGKPCRLRRVRPGPIGAQMHQISICRLKAYR